MNKITQQSLMIISIFVGVFLTLVFQRKFKIIKNYYISKAPLIKKYWLFVIPFVFINVVAYVLVIYFSQASQLNNNISILNQATTLIFAVFAGYFAFQQVVENRFDKLKEQGLNYFKQQSYLRAIQYYEEAYSINPKDFSLLAELIEIYLSNKDYEKFDQKIIHLKKLIIEDYEWSTFYYLKISIFLFKQDLGTAKGELSAFIKLIDKKPSILDRFRWDFKDIKESEPYKKIDGDAKTILDNLIIYLEKKFDEIKKKKFEEGNYILNEEIQKK